MIISVTINRIKHKGSIQEIFTWNPHIRCMEDFNRNATWLLRYFCAKKSLHNRINGTLDNIIYNQRNIIYVYGGEVTCDVLPMETFTFHYNPVLGHKTCRNCAALKRFNGSYICSIRGKNGVKAIKMKGCTDWNEPLYWRE